MLILVCNVCKKELPAGATVHYCEKCHPFAGQFEQKSAQIIADENRIMESRINKLRGEMMREISTGVRHLEAVK